MRIRKAPHRLNELQYSHHAEKGLAENLAAVSPSEREGDSQ
jgi:hypothetical protein